MGTHTMISSRAYLETRKRAKKKGSAKGKTCPLAVIFVAAVFGCSVLLNWTVLDQRRDRFERVFAERDSQSGGSGHIGNRGAVVVDRKPGNGPRKMVKMFQSEPGRRPAGAEEEYPDEAKGHIQGMKSTALLGKQDQGADGRRADAYEAAQEQKRERASIAVQLPSKNLVEEGMGQMGPAAPPNRKGRKEIEEQKKVPKVKKMSHAELDKKGMLGEWVLYRINEPQKLKDVARVQDIFEFQFCQVAHVLHTEEPYRMAFFKDLISASGCDNHREHKRMNWDQAEQYLESQRAENKVIPPTGFLHHEARCGSTLVTNILASNPRAIAYSEPPAVVNAGGKLCRDCPREIRVRLLQLAVGLMGLSAKHDYVFFKLMPSNMLESDLFKEAFPTTRYIWIHRDPVGVMMSQLKVERPPDQNAFNYRALPGMPMMPHRRRGEDGDGKGGPPRMAGAGAGGSPPCLRRLKPVDDSLGVALKSKGEMPSREEYCAEYLAVTSQAAVEAMAADPLGMPLAYEQEPDLATHVIDFLLPKFFEVQLDEDARQRAVAVSRSYSKGIRRGEEEGGYAGDVEKKRDAAWPNLVAEAGEHTRGVYERLVAMEREKVADLQRHWRAVAAGGR